MPSMQASDLRQRTIRDFGEQWTAYQDNAGYYASIELLDEIFAGLLRAEDVRGKKIADIGSGTGRIVGMLAEAGAAEITAVEPSEAFKVLEMNTRALTPRVRLVHAPGEGLTGHDEYDFVVAIGVLHHVPDPLPIVRRAFGALRPGGRFLVWLYGREGNETYLRVAEPLRAVTRVMPHRALAALSWTLDWPLLGYMRLCSRFPLPMASYMTKHLARLDTYTRRLTIYDQLNPAYAKYYRQEEAVMLLKSGGFRDVVTRHRQGYSWTVMGTK